MTSHHNHHKTAVSAARNKQRLNEVHKRNSSSFTPHLTPSESLLICCGCIPIDPIRRKIAFIHDPAAGINQLPKGRKNIGEDISTAALRETSEETGLDVMPLPLKITTRATPTKNMLLQYDAEESEPEPTEHHLIDTEGNWEDVCDAEGDATQRNKGLTDWVTNCEPIAMTTYRCQMTFAFKVVFWYAARANSMEIPKQHMKEAWEQDYQLKWVSARDAAGQMTFEADGEAIEKALSDMRRSGYDI